MIILGEVRLKLDDYLHSRGMTRYQLSKDSGIRYATIDGYYKNHVQRYDNYILAEICDTLECDISDIIEYVK